MAKAFLTGQQILDEYGRIDYDLIVAVAVRKEIQPIDRLSGSPITDKDDPCLYCDGGYEGEYTLPPQIGSQVPGRFCNADPDIFESCICYEWQDQDLASRLRVATFACDDVASYAGKYWIADHGQKKSERQEIETPKEYADQLLADGLQPGQVMLELVKRYGARTMPQWKAAGLALRRPIVDLDLFEKDKLKSRFTDQTKKFK